MTSSTVVPTRSPLLPIFLIVLVDVLGLTIVLPLQGFYVEHFGASPLVAGLVSSCYAACSLIVTPVIGKLSDRYGRRPLLLVSQAGTCIGFLMVGFANSLWLVFAGRIIDGITAGNLSTAQAYISDHTAPEKRAQSFAVIGIAFGIGFAIGPTIASELSPYGIQIPFLVAAGLSACSIVCTYTLLHESKDAHPSEQPSPLPRAVAGPGGQRPGLFDLETYATYFRRPELASLFARFILFAFAFSLFTSGFALFAERRFTTELWTSGDIGPLSSFADVLHVIAVGRRPWTSHEVGRLFTFSGVLGIILQGGLIGRLVKRLGEAKLAIAGFVAAVAAYVVLGFSYSVSVLVIAAVFSSFGNGVLRPVLTSQMSQTANRFEQGVVLGISGSLSSLAMTIAPTIGGALITAGWLVGWAMLAATAAALGLLVALTARKPATT